MIKSDSIKEIAKALNQFQSGPLAAKKTSVNPFFKSNYADLKSVWDSCREALNSFGLSISQLPISNEFGVGVTTILMHTSGEYIGSECTLPLAKNDPQQAGSCITYARRYGLSAILSLMTEEDDDGNKATYGDKKKDAPPKKETTDNRLLLIKAAREKANITKKEFSDFIDTYITKENEPITQACIRCFDEVIGLFDTEAGIERIKLSLPF